MRRPALLRALRGGLLVVSLSSSALLPACLERPVVGIVPGTSGISTDPLAVHRPDKLDLLFVVDNSSSMADKQSELGRRIPALIDAFTRPGGAHPIVDVHVGVITTSLGSFGTTQCKAGTAPQDDKAHLLPRPGDKLGAKGYRYDRTTAAPVATTCPTVDAAKPLTWTRDPAKGGQFGGDDGALALQAAASCVVESAGQTGCGFEQPWEALYRFLADPAPPSAVGPACKDVTGGTSCSGDSVKSSTVDGALLAQRGAFLRPDSLLAVVVLTDENDFSVRDDAFHWRIYDYAPGSAPQATAGCADVPDDLEPRTVADYEKLWADYKCRSCLLDGSDPRCKARWSRPDGDLDSLDVRHWFQVQRFGYDFLMPRERYVTAFSPRKDNKLFEQRGPDQLVLAGIVGVPSGLVADAKGKPRRLLDADWKKLVSPVLTERDPHMIESLAPRPGLARYAGDRAVDPVHGGEHAADPHDLQWACLAPRDPSAVDEPCTSGPTCTAGKMTHFRAYPGVRHLRILKSFGDNAVIGSICSASYAPLVDGIAEKIQGALDHQCVRRTMVPDEDGAVTCAIFEVMAGDTGTCEELDSGHCTPGSAACREADSWLPPLSADAMAPLLTFDLRAKDATGAVKASPATAFTSGGRVLVEGSDGVRHLVCEVRQLTKKRVAAAADKCRDDKTWSGESGFCYSTTPSVVGDCANSGAAGIVRFVGSAEPRTGSQVFTMCRR